MKKVVLNGLFMGTKEQAHRQMKRRLSLPDYYGGNLDALHDCLTELGDTQITFRHTAYMRRKLGEAYASKLLSIFAAATGENPCVKLIVRDRF